MRGIFDSADVIIAKGQGNYESLCNRPENIFFFFKVKCPVIARDSGYDVGTLALIGKIGDASLYPNVQDDNRKEQTQKR